MDTTTPQRNVLCPLCFQQIPVMITVAGTTIADYLTSVVVYFAEHRCLVRVVAVAHPSKDDGVISNDDQSDEQGDYHDYTSVDIDDSSLDHEIREINVSDYCWELFVSATGLSYFCDLPTGHRSPHQITLPGDVTPKETIRERLTPDHDTVDARDDHRSLCRFGMLGPNHVWNPCKRLAGHDGEHAIVSLYPSEPHSSMKGSS